MILRVRLKGKSSEKSRETRDVGGGCTIGNKSSCAGLGYDFGRRMDDDE